MADRQTKLDRTVGSMSPARLEQTRADVEFEIERQKLATPIPEPEDPPVSARMRQLDLIQDVQLILVDRYRFASRMILVAVVLLGFGLVGVSGLIWKNFDLQERLALMQDTQDKLIERGAALERKTDETKAKIDEAKETIDETKVKVDQAVDAAPKIEIDARGQPKVVLPIAKSASPKASSKPLPTQMPVETKRF